jgi:hypothetical protein
LAVTVFVFVSITDTLLDSSLFAT